MARRHSLLFSSAITVPLLVACAGSFPAPRASALPDAAALVIEVDNLNWWDLEVELNARGGRYRLGVATSYERSRFHLRASRLGHATFFRLIANPLNAGRLPPHVFGGRRSIATREIELADGRNVRWTVGSSDVTTTLVVRR